MSALTPHAVQTPTQKDRFLAFAFAAADLLVEVREDGVISFAAGAFNARFGSVPEQFIGRHIRHLFAPGDQPGLDLALSVTGLRGRLAPLVLRLADAAASPVVVSALAMPNAPGRMCFTLGRLPALPGPDGATAPPASFARAVETHLRTEPGGSVGLLEVGGWEQVRSTLSGDAQRALAIRDHGGIGPAGGSRRRRGGTRGGSLRRTDPQGAGPEGAGRRVGAGVARPPRGIRHGGAERRAITGSWRP